MIHENIPLFLTSIKASDWLLRPLIGWSLCWTYARSWPHYPYYSSRRGSKQRRSYHWRNLQACIDACSMPQSMLRNRNILVCSFFLFIKKTFIIAARDMIFPRQQKDATIAWILNYNWLCPSVCVSRNHFSWMFYLLKCVCELDVLPSKMCLWVGCFTF